MAPRRALLAAVRCTLAALAPVAAAPRALAVPPIFADATAASGLDFVHFNGMTGELYFAEMTGAGAALVDYDGDGDLDAYLVQGHLLGEGKGIEAALFAPRHSLPLSDRLYRNDLLPAAAGGRPAVRFVDVTAAAGLAGTGYGMGVAAGDYDGDGPVDLYRTNLGPNQMWRNRGDGTFEDATAATGTGEARWSVPAVFFDYDRDGLLDLFVGNYVDFRVATHKPCFTATGTFDYCGPLAYRPESDRLFHNAGGGRFEDTSAAAGLDAAEGAALGAVAADFDTDGWPDLYVANDGTANFLWRNHGDGTFTDEALLGGCAVNDAGQPEASMGVVAADLDGNGATDLFMSHLTRETNTLYLNDGQGFFRDASRASGLGPPSFPFTGFGIARLDYDLDGESDLFVANGAVRIIEELVRAGDPYPLRQRNQLFHGEGGGRFVEVDPAGQEILHSPAVGRGVAVGDVDLDGDADILLANNSGPARLLLAVLADGGAGHFSAVQALDRGSGRDLLGTEVTLAAGGVARRGRIATDGSYASASEPVARFGLGPAAGAVDLEVRAPDGLARLYRGVPADARVAVYAGAARRKGGR